MWLHICMACPMTAYICDVSYVQPAHVVCHTTKLVNFCFNAIPYFIYFFSSTELVVSIV